MNKFDHSAWFGYVVDVMHRRILRDMGYENRLNQALDEVYSCRWRFRDDEEMNKFFANLIHVKMDLTADGPLQSGDLAVDTKLVTLNNEETSLYHYLDNANQLKKPLVVFTGSWT
eukprot:TRINITY_DN3848_c0_g1_i11.p1 TRINITY_DN3848_c0_g1~~TRINITY_DN3848_c0_g1_i11.p1  ORF type:complete len:115 (-),score=19.69 TRINITY_DN3848_c0_g1_i11:616-960(-)